MRLNYPYEKRSFIVKVARKRESFVDKAVVHIPGLYLLYNLHSADLISILCIFYHLGFYNFENYFCSLNRTSEMEFEFFFFFK